MPEKLIAKITQIGIASLSALFLVSSPATAQIIPDRTLGRESSTVVPVSNTRDDIRGGATRGSNLFHSFREFNVNDGRSVYFTNPIGVQNIINRVTGSNISNIFGTLGVNGNANLYLINPNGIVFGDGARLDINGSFVGTTADGVRLGTSDVYSATDPASSNLLTIQPGALFVNRKNAALKRAITNQSNLEVAPGQNITLSADEINNNGKINAPGGNVFLEAVNGNINTGNIDTTDAINGGGDIDIFASGAININGEIDASGGDVILENFGLAVDFSEIITANSGNVTLRAGDDITFNNDGANLFPFSVFLDGSNKLTTVGFLDDYNIFAIGKIGGKIEIETQGDLIVNNGTIENDSLGDTIGKGGDITIKANSIELIDTINPVFSGSTGIRSETFGAANAGNITINTLSLGIDGAGISTSTAGSGKGGNIAIDTNLLRLDGALISAFTVDIGNAGNITIDTNLLRLDGAAISTNTGWIGNAGNIDITAKEIKLIGGGIFSDTFNEGNSGEVIIRTGNLSLIDGAQITTIAYPLSDGNSGTIKIFADNIDLQNFSFIGVSNFGTGTQGNIIINANSLNLDRGGIFALGDTIRGGNIEINLDEILTLSNNSGISAGGGFVFGQVFLGGSGGGGDVNINSPIIIANPRDNFIEASSFSGEGGEININTRAILGYPQFLTIDASSSLGIDGNVNIEGLSNQINTGVRQIDRAPISEADKIEVQRCPLKYPKIGAKTEKKKRRSSLSVGCPSKPAVGWYRRTDGTVVLTDNPALVRPLNMPIDYPTESQKSDIE